MTGSALRWSVICSNGTYPSHRAALHTRSVSHFHVFSSFSYARPSGLHLPDEQVVQAPVVDRPAALADLEAHGFQGVAEPPAELVALGAVLPERVVVAGQHGQVLQGPALVHVLLDHAGQRRAAEQRHRRPPLGGSHSPLRIRETVRLDTPVSATISALVRPWASGP